ncbi:replicative DNA helicase [Desulforegula conservatrix]|uniref:replicative DNA helicase n=1 Tax=Desulforegula conservatrix TaxID=153026 RepID=UPI0004168D3C|nr:replicative DNA helicase [Desulforegula conservatrix]
MAYSDSSSQGRYPQNVEAEESVISAVLLDNSTLIDVVEILSPDDFYKPSHKKIFAAVSDLFAKSEPVDLVTLSEMLQKKGQLEEIGGASYLARIIDTAPMAVNARHYAKIIKDKAVLGRLINKASTIIQKCHDSQVDVEDAIDFAETAIFEASGDKIKPSFYSISNIIQTNIDTLEDRQNKNEIYTGTPAGFRQLDNMTSGLQNSDLIILAARPSMGKTAFALNIARNTAFISKKPVAVFSLEMSKEQLSMRMLASEARVDSSLIRNGKFSSSDWHRITEAAGILSDAPIFIDDSPDLTAMEIRAKSRRLKMEKDLGLIIIDYLQLMRGRAGSESRTIEVSEISRSLKALAKELQVPVIALSQLNRMLEQRSDKRPIMSDLRESGALEQDADLVMFIYRDEVYNKDENNPNKGKAEIIIAKQRNGPVGTVHLAFLGQYTRFEDLAYEPYHG